MESNVHPDLLVGLAHGDDAAVWRRPGGRALVATVDFFTPIVDDARTWGRIGAANSASDVYAMGGTPMFALNVVAWPKDVLPIDLLGDVLAGASEVATAGGWIIAGGHTVDGPEPMFGQVVIGEVDESLLLTNIGATVGDWLVLTKPLGTGIIATAHKRLEPHDKVVQAPFAAAVASMTALNDSAAVAARNANATACTDVTGFGLAGHLHKMLLGSGVGAEIARSRLPLLTGTHELIEAGFVPGGTHRNLTWLDNHLIDASVLDRVIIADPQTSGGLLFSCAEPPAGSIVIGRVTAGQPGTITMRDNLP